jgi:quercetin dioxygenase-like cupin family protein
VPKLASCLQIADFSAAHRVFVPHTVELWSWTLKPAESHESEPHAPGSIELLTVTTGALGLHVGVQTFALGAGDSGWFDASMAHAYRNLGRSTTRFTMVVFVP